MNDELKSMYDALYEIEMGLLSVRVDAASGDTTESKNIIGTAVEQALQKVLEAMNAADPERFAQYRRCRGAGIADHERFAQ